MRKSKQNICRMFLGFATLAMVLTASPMAKAQSETVLYDFAGSPNDGTSPSGLVMDAQGNLYGAALGGTSSNCSGGCGVAYELVNSSGTYTEKVLFNFTVSLTGGNQPSALIIDASGNLYGVSFSGGSANCTDGCGTVFELENSAGSYAEKILYSFAGGTSDGSYPIGSLVMDSAGNLYGTTYGGGSSDKGTVFELVNSSGSYTEKVLYSFMGPPTDGAVPESLIVDEAGNLFGTTQFGGGTSSSCPFPDLGCGIAFELVNSSGSYAEKVLHIFPGSSSDGNTPESLVMDAAGNLYGTTLQGGAFNLGTVYELVKSSGSYTEEVLHSFAGGTSDGQYDFAGLLMDSAGNLFGATAGGGDSSATSNCPNRCGTLFEMANSSGSYTEKVLYLFAGGPNDGAHPYASLIMDKSGNFYGTTSEGGASENGIVFKFSVAPAATVAFSPSSLSFSNVALGITSAPQSVTVKNTGAVDLTFGSGAVTLSGTNAADFAITSDGCSGQTLVPTTGACLVAVAFTPSASGSETASLVFTDNASGSPQRVSLSGTSASTAPAVSLSPGSLTFPDQLVQSSSTAQTVTLKNTGNASLTISSVTVSGDYSETNNCGASVAAGTSCTVHVTFSPTATGSRTGSISVADNASNSPQSVSLTGDGADLTITTSSSGSSSATVSPGQTANYSLTLAGASGFSGQVAMTCTGAPAESTCAVQPSSLNLSTDGSAQVTATATTTANGQLAPNLPVSWRRFPLGVTSIVLLLLLAIGFATKLASRQRLLVLASAGLLGAILMAGCGGGSSAPAPAPSGGTPAGTYTLTVTATAASGGSRTTTLTLKVN